jgi:hypothetical protein
VIVIGNSTDGLFRVSQAGGMPTRMTTPDESHGEIGHLRPWFLPDGRHFLYIVRARRAEDWAIYLTRVDGKERKRLVSARQAGAYAPPAPGSENGHLLFLREGTLMAQPLDPRRFEPIGDPLPVAEQVGSILAMGFFSVSANGVLAYRSATAGGIARLVWFDREGKSLGTVGPPGGYTGGLALSPDGNRVAVDQTDQTGNHDIWLLDTARGVPTRFTFDARPAGAVAVGVGAWSPDGSRLVFADNRAGNFGIYQKDSSGSGNEELLLKTPTAGLPMRPWDWSPDGRHLLYGVLDPATGADLWVLPAPTGNPAERKPIPYLQTRSNELQGQFSPDGHWIVYVSGEGPSKTQIYVQSFPVGTGKFQISTGDGGREPRWRRDGKELFYIATDGKLMAVEVKTAPRFEAGVPKALFDSRILGGGGPAARALFRYDVAADGKRFLVAAASTATQGSAARVNDSPRTALRRCRCMCQCCSCRTVYSPNGAPN